MKGALKLTANYFKLNGIMCCIVLIKMLSLFCQRERSFIPDEKSQQELT